MLHIGVKYICSRNGVKCSDRSREGLKRSSHCIKMMKHLCQKGVKKDSQLAVGIFNAVNYGMFLCRVMHISGLCACFS